MASKSVRVRFAPSPTGPLHMGGVRTALYNYIFAKQKGGTFILRLEDTDQTRFVKAAENYIHESLEWCGLIPDEGPKAGGDYGPYRQSERKEKGMYGQYAERMIEEGLAYYAFDTTEELEAMREKAKAAKQPAPQYNAITRNSMKNSLTLPQDEVEKKLDNGDPYVIRIKVPRNEDVRFYDTIRGWVVVHSSNMDDKVLLKADGMPTYHLANVVDDYTMKISHVIRGEEWLPSAPLHVLLYRFLGWEESMPEFAHLPLILKPDGNGKLSKRDGDRLGFPVFPLEWNNEESGEQIMGYRENGYFPEAFINTLAFLGWNPGTEQELFSLHELVENFSLERVGKAGAKFDPDKARWYNQQYLRQRSDDELAQLLQPLLKQEKGIEADFEYLKGVCHLMKERATFLQDMLEGMYFFHAPEHYEDKVVRKKWKNDTPDIIKELRTVLANLENFEPEVIETSFKQFLEEKGLGFGKVMPNFRLLLTGKGAGPSIFHIASLIGKEETLKRIDAGLEVIPSLKEESTS